MIKLQITTFLLICCCQTFSQDLLSHFAPEYFEQQRFAHRGGYANSPENTLQTILYNIENGINAIEIDVQLTKDNQLVLFHDQKISRVLNSNIDLDVWQLSLSELKKIPLRDTTKGLQHVCSLKELIDTLAILIPGSELNDFILEMDFKPHGYQTTKGVNALVDILNTQLDVFGDGLYNYFFVSTFYPEVLKQLNKTNPKIVTAFAVNNSPDNSKLLAKLAILMAPKFIKKNNVNIIEPNICMISDRFVRKWHKKGILINAYTANTNCEKKYLETFQIAYTTNCPNLSCEPDPSDQIGKPKKWCEKCN